MILAIIYTITACGNKSNNEVSQQNQSFAIIDGASNSSGAVDDLQDEQEFEPSSKIDNTQKPNGLEALAENDGSEQQYPGGILFPCRKYRLGRWHGCGHIRQS